MNVHNLMKTVNEMVKNRKCFIKSRKWNKTTTKIIRFQFIPYETPNGKIKQ